MTHPPSLLGAMLLGVVMALALAACGTPADERPRCAQCGMYADDAPQWAASAREPGGPLRHFDGPKCLLRYAAAAGAGRDLTLTVTEYYSQTSRPAGEMLYVRGSDLRSPMGRDLVPLDGAEAAAEFTRDHGGDVLTFGEITPAVLAGLDP